MLNCPVAGVDEGVVEPTGLAARPQREKAREQLASAATRAAAGDAAPRTLQEGRLVCTGTFIHDGKPSTNGLPSFQEAHVANAGAIESEKALLVGRRNGGRLCRQTATANLSRTLMFPAVVNYQLGKSSFTREPKDSIVV